MKKLFLYMGFLGTTLLAGTSLMAQTSGKARGTAPVRVSDSRSMKPATHTTTVRAVTPQQAKAAVGNASRQPQTAPAPAAAPAPNNNNAGVPQKTGGKSGYDNK